MSGVVAAVRRRGRAARTVVAATVLALAAVLAPVTGGAPAQAADARDFDPANIISDAIFFDGGGMTADQVQAFLTAQGSRCTAGDPACLKDYVTTTVERAPDAYCAGYQGGLRQSAAQIIAGVAQSCGVNAKVLLVLLEKEQSLVTRSRPTAYAYERATGFGCPDTAPCNAEYFGLHNQLYLAARQYQRYAAHPTSYNHRAGRTSNVLYHPDAARCGSTPVKIANAATAGLYNYTPYQPNAAALGNLYGTGDSCSSYGNRNFWRLFTDWFGSTQAAGHLLRTAEDATVYLVSGDVKYPIASAQVLGAWAPAGPVGQVSASYLERRRTGPLLGQVMRTPDGTVYFVDDGRKLSFGSCTQVADFGSSCGAAADVTVTQAIADLLTSAGSMRPTVATTDGRLFHVAGGVRREAVDSAALTASSLPTTAVTLTPGALARIPYGAPVLRPGVRVQDRTTGAELVSVAAGLHPVSSAFVAATPFASWPRRPLDSASLAQVRPLGTLTPFVRDAGGTHHLLLGQDRARLPAASNAAPAAAPLVGSDVLAAFRDAGTLGAPAFVTGPGGPLSYVLDAGRRLPVRTSDEEVVLNGGTPPAVAQMSAALLESLPEGPDAAATRFTDVRLTSSFAQDILWLVDEGIADGYEDGTFRPTEAVSRQAMASFLHRAAGAPAVTLPASATFADVGLQHPFRTPVEWLAATGVSTGWADPDGTSRFEPLAPVSRQAMAAFLHRRAGSPAVPLPTTPTFIDVPATSPFAVAVEWLAAEGIATGTALPGGGTAFSPTAPVSRQAMAAFLHRAAS